MDTTHVHTNYVMQPKARGQAPRPRVRAHRTDSVNSHTDTVHPLILRSMSTPCPHTGLIRASAWTYNSGAHHVDKGLTTARRDPPPLSRAGCQPRGAWSRNYPIVPCVRDSGVRNWEACELNTLSLNIEEFRVNHNCYRVFGDSDDDCGEPATLEREYDAPEFPLADGGRHTMFYCSRACAAADAVELWGMGYTAVGPLTTVVKRRA